MRLSENLRVINHRGAVDFLLVKNSEYPVKITRPADLGYSQFDMQRIGAAAHNFKNIRI